MNFYPARRMNINTIMAIISEQERLEFSKVTKICHDYLETRKIFKEASKKYLSISGNDNIIGIIGEFIAIQFLYDKLERKEVYTNDSKSNKGFDLIADGKRVSVKMITFENKAGRGVRITYPWDELIFIYLGESGVEKIGYIKNKDFKEKIKTENPYTDKKMLNPGGVIGGLNADYKSLYLESDNIKYL